MRNILEDCGRRSNFCPDRGVPTQAQTQALDYSGALARAGAGFSTT